MADSSKSEKPTAQRLKKAREEGRFPVSRELVSAVQFTTFVALFSSFSPEILHGLQQSMRLIFAEAFRSEITPDRISTLLLRGVIAELHPLAILAAGLLTAVIACQLAVTKFGIATSQLAPKFERLNPMQRLSSLRTQNVSAFVQSLILLPLFLGAVWIILQPQLDQLVLLPLFPAAAGAARVFAIVSSLLWKAALLFVVLGGIDFYRQKKRHMDGLMMTPQEIREEHKQLEGNPQIKMRIRRLQRDLLRRNMMKEIPKATAVVVNPTHFAVALQYDFDSMTAPLVLAKGKNYLALRIKQRAIEHHVPIIENAPLAQALYKSADVGQEIPPNLYKAVAEVLAYIFKLAQGKR